MRTVLANHVRRIRAYYGDETIGGFMTRGDHRLLGLSILGFIAFFIIVALIEG